MSLYVPSATDSVGSHELESDYDISITEELGVPHKSCQYCTVSSPETLVKCNTCNRWFCNGKTPDQTASHIVTHLTLSRHFSVLLHEDLDLGATTLECYNCGRSNVFNLGYIAAKQDQVVVILCRLPCSQLKDANWDSNSWRPLIDERQFLSWIAASLTSEDGVDSDVDFSGARHITHEQIQRLENEWRLNKDTSIYDLDNLAASASDAKEVLPILMRYDDALQYQQSFAPLVNLEEEHDKSLKESQGLERIQVKWGVGLNNRHLASFSLSSYDSGNLRVALGDEIKLKYNDVDQSSWECSGVIIRLPNLHQEEFTLELFSLKTPPPTHATTGFTADFVWKSTTYDRMQEALRKFAVDEKSVSSYIYHKILGHEVKPIEFDTNLPSKLSAPGLVDLNQSQTNAVRTVLKRPLSLIQGPPGTGKTVTSATIIYHMRNLNKGRKILVCAPSNVAVDHLATKLHQLKIKVVRIFARSKEDVDSSAGHLGLRDIAKRTAKGQLKKLIDLYEKDGELSASNIQTYHALVSKKEASLIADAEVICCTCLGAADKRLKKYEFRSVLIDESTQAAEPEVLIPIVKGARQVVLVGDHQQLGPVILNKQAGNAGLKQSLFERLISLGHVPIRLEVQYRMNPMLSEFPSNMFYEGSLQDGVSKEERSFDLPNFPWPIADTPMMFWSNFGKEEISASGVSYLNRVEAMNVEKIVTRLFKDGIKPEQIGVITPYEGQRAFLTQYMTLNGSLFDRKDDYLSIEITSVDAFQGREKDFIILSCVRANSSQIIGFLRDPRRLNVALTRARYGLIILGNAKALSKNVLWGHLLLHYREKGCLVDGPLDNLQLLMVQLQSQQDNKRFARANDGGVSNSVAASVSELGNERQWPALQLNFHSKLNKLDREYQQNRPMPEDDIRSITSSFAAGFVL